MFPCRHLCLCRDCAQAMQEQQKTNIILNRENRHQGRNRRVADDNLKCPICRKCTTIILHVGSATPDI
jgi:hypothetical protein